MFDPTFAIVDLKEAVTFAGGIAAGVVAALGVLKWLRKESDQVEITGQPLRVSQTDPVVTRSQCAAHEEEVKRRLALHDAQLDSLWNTVRGENIAIRKEMEARFAEIIRALGRIEGKLEK